MDGDNGRLPTVRKAGAPSRKPRPSCLPGRGQGHHFRLEAETGLRKRPVAEGVCLACGLKWLHGDTNQPRFRGYLDPDLLASLRDGGGNS